MAIVLSGSTGIQNPLGSAAAPSESNTTNSNTGAYFPTGTTYGIATNGSNAMYIDASQNVGIGTSSPTAKLDINSSGSSTQNIRSGASSAASLDLAGNGTTVGSTSFQLAQGSDGIAYLYNRNSTGMVFGTSNTERMRIDSTGNVGIGQSAPKSYSRLHVGSSTHPVIIAEDIGSGVGYFAQNGQQNIIGSEGYISFKYGVSFTSGPVSSGTEAMRIDTSGNLLVGTTSTGGAAGGITLGGGLQYWATYTSYNSFRYGMYLGDLYWNNGSDRMKLSSAGALQTTTGTISALSDVNYKDNIIDAPDYLSLLNQVRVRKFSYKEENASTQTHIGVIAQELETVLPEMVSLSNSSDGTEEFKVVRYTDFTMMLIKAIQELSAEVTALKAKVGA